MAKNYIKTWLNDAYAMEKSLEKVLESHAKSAKDSADIQERIQQHVEETRKHSEMIEQCLRDMEESPSSLKAATGSLTGRFQGFMSGGEDDGLIKNVISDLATEHYEIAFYNALAHYADSVGLHSISIMCEEIIEDERGMASYLASTLPTLANELAMNETAVQVDLGEPAFRERLNEIEDIADDEDA
jgi:ferritin-like metal-binding protein YciE